MNQNMRVPYVKIILVALFAGIVLWFAFGLVISVAIYNGIAKEQSVGYGSVFALIVGSFVVSIILAKKAENKKLWFALGGALGYWVILYILGLALGVQKDFVMGLIPVLGGCISAVLLSNLRKKNILRPYSKIK